ncbi:hypothetical protein GOV11_04285 [Candidatus Woesearchaeota archaeon]|nr:hypothetical protein [Candidatus Woesearchaeota archaeon]
MSSLPEHPDPQNRIDTLKELIMDMERTILTMGGKPQKKSRKMKIQYSVQELNHGWTLKIHDGDELQTFETNNSISRAQSFIELFHNVLHHFTQTHDKLTNKEEQSDSI